MRATGLVLVSSVLLVVAIWLIVTGWRQPRPRVADAMQHLARRPADKRDPSGSGRTGTLDAIGRAATGTRTGLRTITWERPLHLIGRSVDVHVGMLVTGAVAGFLVPSALLALAQLVGLVEIGWLVPLFISLAAAVLTPVLIHSDAMSRADTVRIDLRHQLGAFIDMVTMLLAGNTGYEGALDQAARAGDGLLFRQLQRRMREVGTTGRSLVEALSLVADEYGIVELEQVAATATLSANEGAPVARSLAAKCSTLRNTLAADEEASARIRNDKVTPPLVGMALLFMALIIYPALNLN
jgi:tight adherence protein C